MVSHRTVNTLVKGRTIKVKATRLLFIDVGWK